MSQVAFQYRAIDQAARGPKGVLQAADRNEAFRQLSSSGLRPVTIEARSAAEAGGTSPSR